MVGATTARTGGFELTVRRVELVAYCGLYCGACGVYRQVHDQSGCYLEELAAKLSYGGCKGCGSDLHSTWCRDCVFRDCAKERGVRHCADCGEFPCPRIAEFDGDGVPHHAGILANLRRLQQVGIEPWLEEQRQIWSCRECGSLQQWYSRICTECGQPFAGLEEIEE